MLNQLSQSRYVKQIALLLVVSILTMSFKLRADGVVLNAGTGIALETASTITSDQVTPGQILDFKVRSDIKVGDKIVIPAGSLAKGQVMRAEKAKGLGKEGFIEIQLKSVKAVDGQDVALTSGNVFKEGEDRQTLSIVLGVVVCILFLTMKGKNAVVPAGYEVNASVAANTTINVN